MGLVVVVVVTQQVRILCFFILYDYIYICIEVMLLLLLLEDWTPIFSWISCYCPAIHTRRGSCSPNSTGPCTSPLPRILPSISVPSQLWQFERKRSRHLQAFVQQIQAGFSVQVGIIIVRTTSYDQQKQRTSWELMIIIVIKRKYTCPVSLPFQKLSRMLQPFPAQMSPFQCPDCTPHILEEYSHINY
jgi:hypothetical protein